jgi:hypothetical protein
VLRWALEVVFPDVAYQLERYAKHEGVTPREALAFLVGVNTLAYRQLQGITNDVELDMSDAHADDAGQQPVPPATQSSQDAERPVLGRLSVNVTPNTMAALDRIAGRDGITVTEALRRLVGYGDLVDRTICEDGGDLLVRHGQRVERIKLVHEPDRPSRASGSTQEMVPE